MLPTTATSSTTKLVQMIIFVIVLMTIYTLLYKLVYKVLYVLIIIMCTNYYITFLIYKHAFESTVKVYKKTKKILNESCQLEGHGYVNL